ATILGTSSPPVSTQGIMAQRRLLSTRVVALLALLAVVVVAIALFRPGGVFRPQKVVSSATSSGAGTDTTQANGAGNAGSGGGGTATTSGKSTTISLANTSLTKLTVARISGRTRPDATGLILKAPNVPAGSYAVWAKVTVYPKSNVGWEYVTCFVSHGNINQHDDTSFSAGTGAQLPSTSYITDTLSMEAGIKLTAPTDVMLGCTTSQTVDFLVTDPVIMLLPVDQIS
ncbi:MAG TPA: hypothetical protein VKQ71_00260, partial [Acidimicrobiales bacterium]|nr:hypothetical protein [Acidimicrobiales bacterium]